MPDNHWAYDYVKQLGDRGILTGYGDGTFRGDQTMTRYEMVALIYRVLKNGAEMDAPMSRLIQEFRAELALIRVDTVERDRDGHPVIERVRVNRGLEK